MLKLYNTASQSVEKFKSITPKKVSIYSCGPTVYDRQHIGNLRKSLFDDLLKRVLMYNQYLVYSINNITDVGHLVSDADDGDDKMEKGSKKENLSAKEIAKKYTDLWLSDLKKLNILPADHYPRATEYIKEQINLIKRLEKKSFTYIISDGVYFDTSRLPEYANFARLDIKNLRAGARVNMGEKLNPTDFALWKFSTIDEQRQQEWDSPWGIGFPGWHSECVVMADKLLHAPFDIHTGGKDHINVHHTNEIAQFKADTGKSMANYWLHSYFLTVKNNKMSKSEGSFITLDDIIEKGYSPLEFRLIILMGHYRTDIDFSWEAMTQAKNSLKRIKNFIERVSENKNRKNLDIQIKLKKLQKEFKNAINNDLDTPKAISYVFNFIKDINSILDKNEPIPKRHIIKAFIKLDRILGLDLVEQKDILSIENEFPKEILALLNKRNKAREAKDWARSDKLREQIKNLGYEVKDEQNTSKLIKL